MMKTLFFMVSAIALSSVQAQEKVERASALLEGEGIVGNVTFTEQPDGNVHISGSIRGLAAGQYGFHVHEKGDKTGGCLSMGPHFNPFKKDHGHPSDENRHVGDLGNVVFDESRTATLDFIDRQIKLNGPCSIIGRGLVLHAQSDDFGKSSHPDSKKTGNAGGRVACGVIGIMESKMVLRTGSSATTVFNISYVTIGSIISLIYLLLN